MKSCRLATCIGFCFSVEWDVGAEVIDPDRLGLRLGASRTLVEENDVGLHARLDEDASGQAEDRVQIGRLQRFLADDLARVSLEEYVVRHDHRGLARRFQDRVDVLDEVELPVAVGCPEILAVVDEVFLLLFAFLIREGEEDFLPKCGLVGT